jgi:hypothetical protein
MSVGKLVSDNCQDKPGDALIEEPESIAHRSFHHARIQSVYCLAHAAKEPE